MRENIKLIAVFCLAGYVISTLIHRDISSMWVFGATLLAAAALALVTFSIARGAGSRYSFASSIFFLFLLLVPLSLYRWAFVAFDRPVWLFHGLPFDLFIAFSFGILAAMLRYWLVIGHMQNQGRKYSIWFVLILFLPLVFALVIYYDETIVPIYTRGR